MTRPGGSAKFITPPLSRRELNQEIEYDLESPKRKKLIAEAVYDRLTNPMRKLAPGK
jgi:hypothetical protein